MLDPLDDPNSTTTSREDVDADLDKRRKVRDYNEENWFYWLRIVGAIVVTALTFALVIVYLWHLVAPTEWRWVLVDDLEKLERLSATVLAGVIATLSVSYVFRR